MTDTTVADTGSAFSPAEEAYFSSGGEGTIPEENSSSAAAPAPAAGADPAAAAADPAVVAAKGGDNVPLARFLEEKKSRKALETQIAEMRGKFSIIEKLNAPAAPGADPAAPVAPATVDDDIFGAVKRVDETVAQMQKRLDDAAAAETAKAEQTAFVNNYRADADAFTAKTPDYKAAYDFLLQGRAAELMAIGYDNPNDPTLTPEEKTEAFKKLHDALVADEFAIAQMAIGKKKSPAEMLYGLAKQRGYKAAAPAAGAEPGKGAAILDQIERGQAEHKSLAPVGGASGDPGMTAERLIAMPADEFENWCTKNQAAAKRIFGG